MLYLHTFLSQCFGFLCQFQFQFHEIPLLECHLGQAALTIPFVSATARTAFNPKLKPRSISCESANSHLASFVMWDDDLFGFYLIGINY